MGFFEKNWINILISLVLSLFAFSLYYNALNYCDGIPYPLALCGVYRIGYYIYHIIIPTLIALITDPKAFFQALVTSENAISQIFIRTAFVDMFLFFIVVIITYVFLDKLILFFLINLRVMRT